jgi:hypothetical protein
MTATESGSGAEFPETLGRIECVAVALRSHTRRFAQERVAVLALRSAVQGVGASRREVKLRHLRLG